MKQTQDMHVDLQICANIECMHIIITAGSVCYRLHFNLNYSNPALFFPCECLPLSSLLHIPFADLDFKARAEVVNL